MTHVDRERLAEALWEYVAEHGWLELGAVERAFMPGKFREIAAALADLYDAVPSEPTDQP